MHAKLFALVTALAPLPSGCSRTEPVSEAKTAQAQISTIKSTPRTMPLTAPPDDKLGTRGGDFGLAIGAPAPDARVFEADGKEVSLAALYARGPTLIVFYRGGWCPFCNTQLHALAEANGDFTGRGVSLVAISVDKADEASKTRASWTIPFAVLADPLLAAHDAFRVTRVVDASELEKLRGFGIDLEQASGQTHHKIAVPSIFLVALADGQPVVRWAHVDPEYKVRPSVAQLLQMIDRVLVR